MTARPRIGDGNCPDAVVTLCVPRSRRFGRPRSRYRRVAAATRRELRDEHDLDRRSRPGAAIQAREVRVLTKTNRRDSIW